jgi:hypothetical protein
MIEHALKYAKNGWHVFPLQPNGKAPLIKGGGGFEAATVDEAQISRWWTDCPTANIGISLDPSGLCVVDIDTHGDVNGYDSMHLLDLPATLTASTAGGGRHIIYLNGGNPPPRKVNVVKKLDGKGIDLLANGYIVGVPSVVDGRAYAWESSLVPVSLPESIRELAAPAVVATPPPWQAPSAPRGGNDVVERARLYLAKCEPAYEGQGGHSALMWAARCMVTGFLLDRSTALSLLWSDFNPRCSPAWDQGNASDLKDFERKVNQVLCTPSQHREGWLLDEHSGESPEIISSLAGFFDSFASRFGSQSKEEAKPASAEALKAVEDAWANQKELRVPELNPGGLVGEVFEHFERVAIRPQAILSLAGALTMCGTLLGRKVKSAGLGARTNLYCIGTAPSSWGKDNVLQQIEEIFEAVGCGDLIGGTAATGDSAMEKRLTGKPTTLYLWDEVGHTLAGYAAGRKGNDSHAQTAVPFLMKVWSSSGRTFRGKDRAGEDNGTASVHRPCLSLYGTGTPDRIASAVGFDQLNDGWLPRCLYFIAKVRGEKRAMLPTGGIPVSILDKATQWHRFQPLVDIEAGESILMAEGGINEVEVPIDADANALLGKFDAWADVLHQKDGSTGIALLWGKATENATRIALIVACGRAVDLKSARINLADVKFSCDLVKYLVESFIQFIEGEVSGSEAEGFKKLITKIVKLKGKKGISQSELTRSTQSISGARERNGYLMDLVEAGILIKHVDNGQAGRPSVRYIYNPTTS